MLRQTGFRRSDWGCKVMVLAVICALLPGCQPWNAPQFYIPLAYGLTGLCIALLMMPTISAAAVGFVLGGLIGAAVYNNSLKRQIVEGQKTGPRTVR